MVDMFVQGYLAHKKSPTPLGPISTGLLEGPRGRRFLVNEVFLYRDMACIEWLEGVDFEEIWALAPPSLQGYLAHDKL